ncbi:amino acid permease [Candidatus Woesearchaeota archaeon]|nr:amino acid permease [Candidatus Woesearchaeota archaeon]
MPELKKVLNFPTILLITINSIVGTGIFFLPAVGAKHAGPASIISWLIMAVISIYIAMCFGELTSMFPKAGGVYEFCKHAYGRFASFIIGWATLIAGNITIAMLVVGAIQYLLPFHAPFVKIPLSLFFIIVFNYIAYKGMKTSAVMLTAFAFITLTAVLGLAIPGAFHIQTGNFMPFFVFPASAIFVTVFFIAETFFGWETATFLAEETKDGEKVMPKALILGTIIIGLISIGFVATSLGSIDWQTFGQSSAPLIDLSRMYYGGIGESIFTILVYLAIIGSVAGWIVSAPRLILAMARDRLFLSQLATIHPKYNTPHHAIIFQTILSSIIVFAGAGSYNTLLLLLVPVVLLMYSAVIFSLVMLRIKRPDIKRYYKAPLGKIGPILIVLFNLALIAYWVMDTPGAVRLLSLGISFILLGIPVYFLLEMYYSPRAVRRTDNILAYSALLFEGILFPKPVRRKALLLLGHVKGKTVLEFGCSVGTLTMHLAEEVGKKGKVYATDISEKDIAIAEKRLRKKGHDHVKVVHDPQHMYRVHPDVPKLHAVISVGNLSYVRNLKKVLTGLNKRLAKGGKICFVDYDKFFDVIPNIEWLADDKKIKKIFEDAGFYVDVFRRQGFAWKYIFIYGAKFRNV